MIKKLATALVIAGGVTIATPSYAAITTFAAFSPAGSDRNIMWTNDGAGGGQLFTIPTGSGSTLGPVNVNFSFLQPALAPSVTNVNALFTFNGTTTSNPATVFGLFLLQQVNSGSFSFLSTAAINTGSSTFAAGSNLLSGTFSNATILGSGTSGGLSGSTVAFTSDFLDFSSTTARDFALSLTNASPTFSQANPSSSLTTFRAIAGGQFSSDPEPLISSVQSVPEPSVIALIGMALLSMFGFGLMRRRSQV